MHHRRLLPLLVLALTSAACSGAAKDSGAIESLEEPTPSAEFDAAFWTNQAADDTETWDRALELCRENADQRHPNCAVVLSAAFIQGLEEATAGPFPEYPSDSGSTGVPRGLQDPSEPQPEPADGPSEKSDER